MLVVLLSYPRKLKLKEDEAGNKVSTVQGIRAACKVMKTRYSKPFESVPSKIPYETGMDPIVGPEMFESQRHCRKSPEINFSHVLAVTGEELKEFRKGWTEINCN